MPKISIIVPIYNVEKYLPKCIDSILAQTFNDFELILINDGSTDKCGHICDKYKVKDKRITVVHTNNKVVSSARNTGIELARGDYLAFVDPDDTIEPDMYLLLINAALTYTADIVVCPIRSIYLSDNRTSISKVWPITNYPIYRNAINEEIIPSILANKNFSLISSVNKLYKKSVLDLYNIRFDEKKSHSEDARLNFKLLTLIEKLVFIHKPLYNYYIHQRNSLTKIFREDLYLIIRDNKNFLIDLSLKYTEGNHIVKIKNHFMNVTLVYIQSVILEEIEHEKRLKILSGILDDTEFKEDIKIYNCPSFFYKIIKLLSTTNNIKILTYVVRHKHAFQMFLKKRPT